MVLLSTLFLRTVSDVWLESVIVVKEIVLENKQTYLIFQLENSQPRFQLDISILTEKFLLLISNWKILISNFNFRIRAFGSSWEIFSPDFNSRILAPDFYVKILAPEKWFPKFASEDFERCGWIPECLYKCKNVE